MADTTNTDTTAASGALRRPRNAITASIMRDDGGESPAFCLMVAYRSEAEALAALAALAAPAAQEAEPAGYRISDPEEPEIGSWFSETPARAKYGLLSEPLYAHPPRPQADAGAPDPWREHLAEQADRIDPSDAGAILSKICDLFHIGKLARTESTILVNVENVIRFTGLLRALERDLFPQPELPEDDDPYADAPRLPVPNSWGAKDEADYVAQFRAALAGRAAAPAPAAGAAPTDADLPDVEDMAHSALQEALSFGLGHDVLHRWMRAVMDKTVTALGAAAPAPDAPRLIGVDMAAGPDATAYWTAGAAAPTDALGAVLDAFERKERGRLAATIAASLVEELRAAMAASPAQEAAPLTQAARDVLAERRRQVEAEGWTPEHDDEHVEGDLAAAAASYAMEAAALEDGMEPSPTRGAPAPWPWDRAWWKPAPEPRRNLQKAGALILADIERLDRTAARARQEGGS